MIEFALAQHLLSRSPVTDIIGAKIFADFAPQDVEAPYIVYMQDGGERAYHSTGSSGFVNAAVRLHFHAKTPLKARELYEVVRDEIDGYRGLWGTGDVQVRRAAVTPYTSSRATPSQGDEVGHPAVRAVVDVIYFESVPALGS